ncbi:unnamed protein product [Parnassius apollo]|uniref:Mediator of RNA polymerase II transcription subunit 13 n=1 Tax=Parnassius apollo TaxID=110799 RepID=A0A8S3Y5H8_PARAO|nr:unnamed protein product [Parnassius apollo]
MTHQNHQTNGASLEDCHTNFFALTELFGIKWRKLVWERESSGGGGGGGGEGEEGAAPLADPVISSYARCLAGDILCVWRRVPAHQPPDLYDMPAPPPLSLRAAKELWIFWYGEEPDLNGLVAPELIASQGDQGSWESGLSYECRSLLFKALHNLIERCLLSRDFVRLGKWFVQPYDGDEEDVGKSPWHLSFSFAFFLHGESTVCASVDVRQHPPVRTLTAKRLARLAAADHRDRAKVILAPFGLEGRVTGREWSDGDPTTARLLDAWRQLYPLEHGCGAVEVECGGVRMRYPLPYALLTEMEAPSSGAPAAAASALARRALRSLTTPRPHQTPELCYDDTSGDKCEDFLDPTRKTPCTCAKAVGGACSPGSCGASPAPAVSAPSSAGAPPPSPHLTALPAQSGGAVPTTLHTPAPTPDPHAPPTPAPPSAPPHKLYPQGDSPSYAGNGNGTGAATGSELLRRPVLPPAEQRLDPLEDEHSLHMLYDYTTVHAWLEHPVKRFKAEARGGEWDAEGEWGERGECGERGEWREWRSCREWSGWSEWGERLALGARAADLYAGLPHTPPPAPQPAPPVDLKQERNDDDVKEYKNLFTSDGLCPTLKDLDQIFDNSDDAASGDETMALAAGAGAGAGAGGDTARCEEARCGGRCVRAEELSKMFPTPPSMEAHAQPSPGFSLPDDATPQPHVHRHLLPGSPPPDPIEDWSYVFKPPTVCKYVGSSKYAALSTLPSQLLPAVALPPHAVYRPRWQLDAPCDPDPDPHPAPPRTGTANSTNNSSSRGLKRPASPSTDARPASVAGVGPGAGTGAVAGAGAGVGSPRPQRSPASPGSVASPQPPAAACPLLLNVLLTDTVLNVFRDHNFDSCTLCVCDTEVGNIRGADAAAYLAHGEAAPEHESVRCSCGFSAIVNRRLAHRAGLFYEDELEITGLAVEAVEAAEAAEATGAAGARGAGAGRGAALAEVAGVLAAQCAAPAGGPASALARAAARPYTPRADHLRLNLLEYSDGGAAATCALREASTSGSAPAGTANTGSTGSIGCTGTVHRWPFIGARAPRSSRDVVRLMRRLRPLLQDAIQKRCCGARMWDGVTGPLTWRQFHRLAGRGNEDLCEPQPVPPLLVGHDRDWISLSPYALRHWERLSLEPYSYARDVAFVALAADGEALADPLRTFFRELSTAYEACRLGRHQPITRIARDGIVRTPPAERCDTDEWAGELPPGRLGEYVRAYAEALRELVAQLSPMTIDRTLFEGEKATGMRPPVAPERPDTPGGGAGGGVCEAGDAEAAGGGAAAGVGSAVWAEEDEAGPAALVLYLVEPPAAHAHHALALLALLRLAAQAHHHLQHHNPFIKIISLEGVLECGGTELRTLAFSVFSGARRLLQHQPNGKSLTGFGTAANANLFLNSKDEKNRAAYRLFSPAWVLAPPRALKEVAETWGQACGDQCSVLFVAYCLSHDQRWLLAAATDARGELLDTAAINIHVPARSRRRAGRAGRAGPARRLGLTKLMDFTLGVMSQAAQPWRLVVGRVGRIGHGELKGWSYLLSRKNLVRASGVLRAVCGSCAALYPGGAPCVLSACLVSTEPDPCLRLMADRFTPDERFSQASIHSQLHTPRDVTATHILVFPTSATTQSNQMPFEQPNANGEDNDIMFLGVDMADEDMGEDNMAELLIGDMFTHMWAQGSPRASPRRHDDEAAGSRDGSPARHHHLHQAAGYHVADDHQPEQIGTMLQQPLALGYLVSTAPLGAMPAWWWAGCAHLRDACPAFLKNALHLHSGSAQAADDFTSLTQRRDHNSHPLDSQTTTDVLRYVLEGYNALSWLALDGTTNDRLSCLPLHVQALMQLYHTAAALG